jgi:hypothetical protein
MVLSQLGAKLLSNRRSMMQRDLEKIFLDIQPLSNIVYESLALATIQARDYNYASDKIDPYLAANIVRHHARHYVSSRSLQGSYQPLEVPNNGIFLRKDDYRIKVLKGRDGEPPIENKTYLSRRFFNQTILPGMENSPVFSSKDWDEFVSQAASLNLILCWHVDEKYQQLTLELMCPCSTKGRGYSRSTEVYWRQEVPDPSLVIEGVKGRQFVNEITVNLDEEVGEELP